MKQIDISTPSHPNTFVLVDDEDYDRLSQWKWFAFAQKDKSTIYAARTDRTGKHKTTVRMHRVIVNAQAGESVDHRDGNGLNNQRANLRICTASENSCNRGPTRASKSGFRGVSWHKGVGRWVATIGIGQKHRHLGYFDDPAEAARVRDAAAKRIHGDFARLNMSEAQNG